MTPRQVPMSPVLTFDPDQRGRSGNKRKRGNLAQRRLHVALDGRVGREHHRHGLPLFAAALQDGGNADVVLAQDAGQLRKEDRKSTRLNSSHSQISYAVFCLKKKNKQTSTTIQPEDCSTC